ncbi:MAG: HI0074 family nucleotidyltransferase substrate-binding subunit [Planctomycetia bacterium]|nr:HI0074 family nucleotidyltransferase substrate-binding subunit [Planctomycetia bacterium]
MKKYENFVRAVKNLHDVYSCQEPYSNIELTGLVGLFTICFEQSWKAMKEILEKHGYSEGKMGSPRFVLQMAYQAGMIDDEETWLQALETRNQVAHAYNESVALEIIRQTKEKFVMMFVELQKTMEETWLLP